MTEDPRRLPLPVPAAAAGVAPQPLPSPGWLSALKGSMDGKGRCPGAEVRDAGLETSLILPTGIPWAHTVL